MAMGRVAGLTLINASAASLPDVANKGSFLQGYNAQAAVDSTAQVDPASRMKSGREDFSTPRGRVIPETPSKQVRDE
jgi:hypothetical protein